MSEHKILKTEMRNQSTTNIDRMTTAEMLDCIQRENAVLAVRQALGKIEIACDIIAERLLCGGRLIYVGAGTSGRLGVLDAAECPPTFGVSRDKVIGIIAGGEVCKGFNRSRHRSRGYHRLYSYEGGYCAKNNPEYAFHRGYDKA